MHQAEVLVLRVKLIDLINDIVHAAVVEVQVPVPLPRCCWRRRLASIWAKERAVSTSKDET